jgi:RHS repeat-associated protein
MSRAALISLTLALVAGRASADDLVQAPQLGAPQRGSLAGEYGHTAFGPADVSRGGFALPSPFHAPQDRGPLLASIFPAYSPDAGLSEWGMGWHTQLAITRSRILGDLDYSTDELTGPWGRMVHGSDGYWYPAGFSASVRVEQLADRLVAYLPDGSTWSFAERFDTTRGTYAWYLTNATDLSGHQTQLTWAQNPSGRRFLSSVRWGGTGVDFQYEADFDYDALPELFVSWQPGVELTLDRRVRAVTIRTHNATSGSFDERWHYGLVYQSDGLGPASFLVEIDQTFVSGETAPPVKYGYRRAIDQLPSRAFQRVPALDPVIKAFGQDVIQGKNATQLDIDHDGRVDLEEQSRYALLQQTDKGWATVELPPAPAGALQACRRAPSRYNLPRTLAQLSATGDAVQVVSLAPNAVHTFTTLDVCSRDGAKLTEQLLTGDWQLGKNVRLVDIDRDRQPDLIRVGFGMYTVLPNQSSASGFQFGAPVQGLLQPAIQPTVSWVQDVNGDGLPDLIARTSSQVLVWYGQGSFQFAGEAQVFDLMTRSGVPFVSLDQYDFSFVDVNKDGLTDLLLTKGMYLFLLTNDGYRFQETPIPALSNVAQTASHPVIADLAATGNAQVSLTMSGGAWSLDLDDAATGLMVSADDGRGTLLSFDYARAPAASGSYQRHAVLNTVTIASTGYDTVTYSYSFAGPRVHSLGRFLLGFDTVSRMGPLGSESMSFLNDDDVQGLWTQKTDRDAMSPAVVRFGERSYEAAQYAGLPWLRVTSERGGFTDATASTAIADRTDYLSWSDLCPASTVHTSAPGTLTTTTSIATVVGLGKHLHCLPERVVTDGRHADARLDFHEEKHFVRNDAGLVTSAESVAPGGTLVLQNVEYNADSTIARILQPGRGATSFAWDPSTHLLAQVTAADGVTVSAAERDPLTDGTRTLFTDRGGASWSQWFRFDGQERLFKSWNSLGAASEANPQASLAYQYATATRLGAISVRNLVDATSGSAQQLTTVETAAGEEMATGTLIPQGWALGGVVTRNRARAETATWLRATAPQATDLLDPATLTAGTWQVGLQHASPLGSGDSLEQLHVDVARQTSRSIALQGGTLQHTEVENGTLSTSQLSDAGGRVVAIVDQAGTRWGYHYDAAGRLRSVDLPDGTGHRAYYDAHGRVARVERDGIADIDYAFDANTGLATSQTFSTPDGKPARAIGFQYDAIGRVSVQTDADLIAGGTKVFHFYYDGATPESPATVTTRGLLTAVNGDGFVKRFVYRADGKLSRRTVELSGWRTVATDFVYSDGDQVRSTTVTVSAGGATLSSSTRDSAFDAYGRLASTQLDGAPFASYGYDGDGKLQTATFAHGETVTLSWDAYSRALVGLSEVGGTFGSVDGFKRNARGLIDTETLGVGLQSVTRSYNYSPQGFLAGSNDAQSAYAYDFDTSGLPTSIEENGVTRTLSRTGATLTAGTSAYQLDGLGRTIQIDDLALGYGPDGNLATATRGVQSWQFLYDEAGQRILKLANGAPVAGYVDEGYLDASGLTEPVKVGSTTVGVLAGGAFQLLATDLRGTVLADRDGTSRLPSPFGNRAVHPDTAAALDYVQKAYDADLGLIRMGVRDYDPRINRFLTPDPLFLSDLSKCLKSPTECSLYGYARNNPLSIVDPNGCEGKEQYPMQPTTIGPEREAPSIFDGAHWRYYAPRQYDLWVLQDDHKISRAARIELGLEKAKRTIEYTILAAFAPELLARMMSVAPIEAGTAAIEAGNAEVVWGPHNGPGPLGAEVAKTFRSATYVEKTTTEETVLYRAYGGKAGTLSPYWTRTAPTGPMQAQMDSALLPEWGNTATKVNAIRVPAGTKIYEGAVAPQVGTAGFPQLMGGGNQVYIPRVNPDWQIKP